MTIDSLKRLFLFILFVLAQALVFNRILLFGCAMPFVYVYFIVMLPYNHPKWSILLWSFLLGLFIDMFANTPGVACASLTLIGALQPYLLELFLPRDAEEDTVPSAKTLGWGNFTSFTIILTFIYCTTFFSIEAFTFYHWNHWLQCVCGSTILSVLLISTLENVRK